MRRSHRAVHAVAWPLLGLALVAAIAGALIARRPPPTQAFPQVSEVAP